METNFSLPTKNIQRYHACILGKAQHAVQDLNTIQTMHLIGITNKYILLVTNIFSFTSKQATFSNRFFYDVSRRHEKLSGVSIEFNEIGLISGL